jgi:MFS family permease
MAGRMPGAIWALGFVSLLMDISSEMIHGLLPVFLVGVLGAGPAMLGLIEGMAEATASIGKVVSGAVSDLIGRRKPLAVLGYGLGAASKPFFALATGPAWVLGARFADRVGKGLRGAPRDALVADLAPPGMAGAAYGLRQALDSVGAFAGPLLAIGLMAATGDDFRTVFWIAVVPGAAAVLLLVLAVREPPRPAAPPPRPRLDRAALAALPAAFWVVVGAGAILTLARMSEAFAILRAEDLGLPVALAPAILVAMNLVAAAVTYPVGTLSDRIGRRGLLAAGFLALALAHLVLAAAPGLWAAFLGAGLWGLHLALSQGLLAALVADTAPKALRGTAFGLFHLASGGALLLASLGAGLIWQAFGATATFLAGALAAGAGLALFLAVAPARPGPRV